MELFLEQLYNDGHVTVPPAFSLCHASEVPARWIEEFDWAARLAFPGTAPELEPVAAAWAAALLARVCQLIVTREAGAGVVEGAFAERCPTAHSASVDYSADLFLRYLPECFELAHHLAPDDPLVARMLGLTKDWPLSSVGITGAEAGDPAIIAGHTGLLRVYADRIIGRGDTGRISDPRVAAAVRAVLGEHTELAPEVAKALAS